MRARKALTGVLALFAVLLGAIVHELAVYIGRSKPSAEAFAQEAFLQECQKRNLDPASFVGPRLQSEKRAAYDFAWHNPNSKESVLVSVLYLPRYTESWYIPSTGTMEGRH